MTQRGRTWEVWREPLFMSNVIGVFMVEYPIPSDIIITTVDQLLEAVSDGEIHEDVAHKILNDNIAKITAFIKDVPNQSW